MKLISFTQGLHVRCGLALSDKIGLDVLAADTTLPPGWPLLLTQLDMLRPLADQHQPRVAEIEELTAAGERPPLPFFTLAETTLLAPIILPTKIIAVGLNYRDHAEEQNKPLPERPLLFAKAPSCLQAPGRPIELPPELDRVDAEAELAVVVGRPGRGISTQNARRHIAGYTCFNDVSDRKAQYTDKQWFRGKSIDTGGPCGPWIVTPDELPDLASGLRITCRWNDQVMQDSNTDNLIFGVDELISYASTNMTLMPGDIISTGTPGGVGVFRDPQVFLKPGDTVEVEIEKIGKLTNPVIAR